MLLLDVSPLTFIARRWFKNLVCAHITPSSLCTLHNHHYTSITNIYVTKLPIITNCYFVCGWKFYHLGIFMGMLSHPLLQCGLYASSSYNFTYRHKLEIYLVWDIIFFFFVPLDSIFTKRHRAVQQEEEKIKQFQGPRFDLFWWKKTHSTVTNIQPNFFLHLSFILYFSPFPLF